MGDSCSLRPELPDEPNIEHFTAQNNLLRFEHILSNYGSIMDRLAAMSVLISVVECGSLSAAARKLGAPLPTVSRRISDLEAHLNTRLLVRSTRRLVLTDAGAAYVESSRRILDEVGEAERAASGAYAAPRGDLVITAPVVFGRLHVLPVVVDFLARWPDINVRLVLADRNLHLIDDHVDMAVRIGALPDSAMTATKVGAVRRVVCGSPAYFAAHGVPRRPEDLRALTAVGFDQLSSSEHWIFPNPKSKRELRVPVRSRLAVNTAEAAIDAAVAGVGVTRVLSYQVAQAVLDGKIQIVLAEHELAPSPVSLIHASQGLMPVKMRVFVDFAAPRLRARLA
jgi:DNA-binding transcriptional LysR family regulator